MIELLWGVINLVLSAFLPVFSLAACSFCCSGESIRLAREARGHIWLIGCIVLQG